MRSNITLITFILLSAYYLPLTTARTFAEGLSLGIEPPIIQIDAVTPASIKTPITIENNGDTPTRLKIQLKAFTASEKQNGMVHYLDGSDVGANPALFNNIQFADNNHNVDSVALSPKQKKAIVMHIGIPENMPHDDYYFSVVFISESQEELSKTSSTTPIGIATNVLLSIGPKGATTGQIEEFSAPFFTTSGPVPFILRLKNTSDHYITPKGVIMIKNMFNQTIGRVDLLPVNVLSGTTRAIPDMLLSPDASKSAHFIRPQTRHEAAVWPEIFLLGPYTAELTLALSDEGPIFRRTIYFFALPIILLVSIVILILLTTFLIIRIKKRIHHTPDDRQ